jgi:hypothetical protein
MPSVRGVRDAAILGAAGLAGVDAFEAAQYRRSGAKGFDLENPPSPGTPDFASTRSRGRGGDPGQPAQRGYRTRSGLLLMRVLVKRTGPDQVDPTTNSRSMWRTAAGAELATGDIPRRGVGACRRAGSALLTLPA